MRQMCQAAIIETAAHPQTVTFRVKGNQWQDQQIQFVYGTLMTGRHLWFRDAKAIVAHGRMRVKRRKTEATCKLPGEYRQIKMLVDRDRVLHERQGADFALHGPVESDMPGPLKVVETHEVIRERYGSAL